jgi:hypothetical protein
MDPGYIKKIQRWVQLDNKVIEVTNKVKALQDEHKAVYEEKDELEKEITEYVSQKNMDMLTINTSDGNIKFAKKNNTQSLSIKVLKTLLTEYSQQQSFNVDDVISFINNNLEKKTKLNIKRNILN